MQARGFGADLQVGSPRSVCLQSKDKSTTQENYTHMEKETLAMWLCAISLVYLWTDIGEARNRS